MHRSTAVTLAIAGFPACALAQAPAPLWEFTFAATDAYGAAPDLTGGVYIAGTAPPSNALLNRFSATGELVWTRLLGSQTPGENRRAYAVCATSEAVFVAGDIFLGPSPNWHYDATLIRVAHGGDQVWQRTFGTSASDYANDVCSDRAGGVYIVGDTLGSLAAPHLGSWDGFLARYDGDGNQLWVRQFGTPALEYTTAAFPDGAGGVYIAGDTAGALGPTPQGGADCWLARYDSSGERLWIRQFGTPMSDGILDLCADGEGGLYAGGWTFGNFGGPASGNLDAFVARLTADGDIIWVRQLGTPSPDVAEAISPDGNGGVYVFGDTMGSLAQPFIGGTRDVFLARYSASGQQLWVRQFGTEFTDYAKGAAPDASGGVYVTGTRWAGSAGTIGTLARFPGPCYPNCDNSTAAPALNIADFSCFLQRFASGNPYANCDESSTAPALNIADFSCFLTKFAAGCP